MDTDEQFKREYRRKHFRVWVDNKDEWIRPYELNIHISRSSMTSVTTLSVDEATKLHKALGDYLQSNPKDEHA